MPYILPSGSPEHGYIVVSGYADRGYVTAGGFCGGYVLSGG